MNGQNGMWMRSHSEKRRALETPCNLPDGPAHPNQIASMRLTIGTYDTGAKFTFFDSWRNPDSAHSNLKRPWTGMSCYFNRDCSDIDSHIAQICSIVDAPMRQHKCVRINDAITTFHDVTPSPTIHVILLEDVEH